MARKILVPLDDDGQPINRGFSAHRNLLKGVESLLGICRGLTADQELNEREILFLDTWLKDNQEASLYWPGEAIAARLEAILSDGVVSCEEASDLKDMLDKLIGSGCEIGVTSGMATQLPLDRDPVIRFSGRRFCLTGKFIYGSRATCETATVERGGCIASTVTQALDYLVIGALASRDWITTSYGRKIEKACEYRNEKKPELKIVSEEDWVHALDF